MRFLSQIRIKSKGKHCLRWRTHFKHQQRIYKYRHTHTDTHTHSNRCQVVTIADDGGSGPRVGLGQGDGQGGETDGVFRNGVTRGHSQSLQLFEVLERPSLDDADLIVLQMPAGRRKALVSRLFSRQTALTGPTLCQAPTYLDSPSRLTTACTVGDTIHRFQKAACRAWA